MESLEEVLFGVTSVPADNTTVSTPPPEIEEKVNNEIINTISPRKTRSSTFPMGRSEKIIYDKLTILSKEMMHGASLTYDLYS
jgi:hypothetical protein